MISTFVRHKIELLLISRRQWAGTGARLHSRGINHAGQASNFVETEQILFVGPHVCSFVQVRGSVPVFWIQHPSFRWTPSFKIHSDQGTKQAFDAHFDDLCQTYGQIHVVNLLDESGPELALTVEYISYLKRYRARVGFISLDFHLECRKNRLARLTGMLKMNLQGYFWRSNQELKRVQDRVFRINCVDCLDRTNVVQGMISKRALEIMLRDLGVCGERLETMPDLYHQFQTLWINNANALSRHYTGTLAQKTSLMGIGARSIRGLIKDSHKSVQRYFLGVFYDGQRQDSMDLFYGRFVIEHGAPSPFAGRSFRRDFLLAFLGVSVIVLMAFTGPMAQILFLMSLGLVLVNRRLFVSVPILIPRPRIHYGVV